MEERFLIQPSHNEKFRFDSITEFNDFLAVQQLLLRNSALLSPPESTSALSPSKAGLLKP
jgi:hypothetical protein